VNGKTILIVEDHPDIRLTVRLSLRSLGADVVETDSAEDALQLIARGGIDLVLLDVTLPHMDGWDLLTLLRSGLGPEDLPVVMLTGHVGEEVAQQADALGADGVLTKPFEIAELAQAVEHALGVHET